MWSSRDRGKTEAVLYVSSFIYVILKQTNKKNNNNNKEWMLKSCRNVQRIFLLILYLTAFNAQVFLHLLCSDLGGSTVDWIGPPPTIGSTLAQPIIFSLTWRPCLVLICCLQDVYWLHAYQCYTHVRPYLCCCHISVVLGRLVYNVWVVGCRRSGREAVIAVCI